MIREKDVTFSYDQQSKMVRIFLQDFVATELEYVAIPTAGMLVVLRSGKIAGIELDLDAVEAEALEKMKEGTPV